MCESDRWSWPDRQKATYQQLLFRKRLAAVRYNQLWIFHIITRTYVCTNLQMLINNMAGFIVVTDCLINK